MTARSLAHCPQVEQAAEVAQVVGDGTWLSTGEAAKLIGVSPSLVIALVDRGELAATRFGNRRRILRTVAEAYRDKRHREAAGQ